jgi:zinc D-Ala-D-Ala dipeptidase
MALPRRYLVLAVLALAAQDRPQVFRIAPVRPVAELRAQALAARPPEERGDFQRSDLVDVAKLDPGSNSTSATPPATTF